MLTWHNTPQKDHTGKVLSVSYKADIPRWGTASIHPHIHHPGEMFLDCADLGIEMYPLGQFAAEDVLDTLNPAETVLLDALKQHGIRCLEAMAAIGKPVS